MRVVQRGNNDTYRVITSSGGFPWGDPAKHKRAIQSDERQRFEASLQRTSSTIHALATLNHWDFWVTLTFDQSLVGGMAMRWEFSTVQAVLSWLHMYNVHHNLSIKYLFVPDLHEDGAFHLHGLLSGVPDSSILWWSLDTAPTARIRARIKSGVPCGSWLPYSARFGFSRIEPLKSSGAAGHYLSSHYLGGIDKLQALAVRLGTERNFLYHSKGLHRWSTCHDSDTEGISLDLEAWAFQYSYLTSFSDFVLAHSGHCIPVDSFFIDSGANFVLWRRFLPDDISVYLDVSTCPIRCDIIRAFGLFCLFGRFEADFSLFSVPASSPYFSQSLKSDEQFFQMELLDSPSMLFPDSDIGFSFVPMV